jgi:hypothetical protein
VNNTTALQALYMMNDTFVDTQAKALAARISIEEETSPARLRLAYRLLYSRTPTPVENQMGLDFLQKAKREETPLSAWTGLMRVLISSNEFFYVD